MAEGKKKRKLTGREITVARSLYRLMHMVDGDYETMPRLKDLPKEDLQDLARISVALCDLWDALNGREEDNGE